MDAGIKRSKNVRKFLENLKTLLSEEDKAYLVEYAEENILIELFLCH